MFRSINRKRRAFIALLTILAMLASGAVTFAAGSSVSISGYTAPSTIKAGSSFTIKGKLNSNYTITRVEVGIAKDKNNWTKYKYDNKKVNARTFDLKRADSTLKFGKLKKGTYYYRVYAHTSDGKIHTVLSRKFKVKKSGSKKVGASISGVASPSAIYEGKGFNIKGKIKASKKIKSVKVGVTYANGTWTSVKYTKKKINAKSFNIKKVDSKIKFGKLAEGNYKFRVDVTTTGGTKTLVNKSFSVRAADKTKTANVETGGVTSMPSKMTTELKIVSDSSAGKALSDDVVTMTGYNAPSNYKVGQVFTPRGTITSKEDITRVEIGIIFTPTNKWTEYKYDNSKVSGKTFNVATAASALKFNMIAGGEYKYRIYVHTKSGIHIVMNHAFKVTSSNKPQEALNWAIQIANDNSFSYGKKPATSKVGCYFCGTNQKRKPKGYEKTYVCMTFVHAAYAHGAGDPELLRECQKGNHCLELTDANFTHYSCWKKIGYCKDLKVSDLKPGDVICWYAADNSSGHLAMYAGNNNIVDAGGSGWGANTIALRKGVADNYLRTGASRSKKSYVMRYRK